MKSKEVQFTYFAFLNLLQVSQNNSELWNIFVILQINYWTSLIYSKAIPYLYRVTGEKKTYKSFFFYLPFFGRAASRRHFILSAEEKANYSKTIYVMYWILTHTPISLAQSIMVSFSMWNCHSWRAEWIPYKSSMFNWKSS